VKWFRKHLKTGSRLALFALAIQFALSFGHFHPLAAAQAAPAIQTGLTQADGTYIGTVATPHAAREAAQKPQPPTPDNDQHPADICAICAVVSLAHTALFATPPLLELPQAFEFLYLTTDAEFVHLRSVHLAFQSRAPPRS
jgi:DUF2946 family protein